MASRTLVANRLYKFVKPDILSTEGARLPEGYKKFYREWLMTKPTPVHFRPVAQKWVRKEDTGEVVRVDNLNEPLPLYFPPESNLGIWGGEAIVRGFVKRTPYKSKVPRFWVPTLKKSAVYSEILDKTMSMTVTERTIDLIIEHSGFDNYLLKTKACDLQSLMALKLKQKMLLALLKKDLYPDNPVRREEVYNKYKHFLNNYTEEEIEWYGLSLDEALKKQKLIDNELSKPVPLKLKYRQEFLEFLQQKVEQQLLDSASKPEETTWLSRINPFKK